ncbi:MAG: AAA family ATPase [Candidatus Andersenbacteria bacterium]
MNQPFIVFITGASGVGKTTLVNNLQTKYLDNSTYHFEHFDSNTVPSTEEMSKQFGSGEKWQETMTRQWVDKLIHNYSNKDVIIFEGQVNIRFIQEAFQKNNFTNYKIILVDSSEKSMITRLTHDRKQPELVTEDMKNWRIFLKNQAQEYSIPIIDTSEKTPDEVVKEFESTLDQHLG